MSEHTSPIGATPAAAANTEQVALVTGSAQRIGADIIRRLHQRGLKVLVHYRQSSAAAQRLAAELNALRPDSARTLQADLADHQQVLRLAEQAQTTFGRLDVLVNNASTFYPTPITAADESQWHDLFSSNLKAPFFLSQGVAAELARTRGVIINIVDIYAERPLKNYPIYSMAKAGLAMMTKSLAKDLAPAVRVNGVAPGAILWPTEGNDTYGQDQQQAILDKVALQCAGSPADIAKAVIFLALEAPYITGQILAVDGGRTLYN